MPRPGIKFDGRQNHNYHSKQRKCITVAAWHPGRESQRGQVACGFQRILPAGELHWSTSGAVTSGALPVDRFFFVRNKSG
jgi:hypothetical protein